MLNERVKHIKFIMGTIIRLEEGYIHIDFDALEDIKVFPYPGSFEKFLTIDSLEQQDKVLEEIRVMNLKKDEESSGREEAIINKINEGKKSKFYRTQKSSSFKTLTKGNIAMKCTFCDGGSSKKSLGFNGICNKDNIKLNISQGRVNCNDSICRQYYDGVISYGEPKRHFKNDGFLYYDSSFMNQWKVYAGWHHKGPHKGETMKFRNVQRNKLTVLTTRLPDETEKERVIFAVYLIKDYFEGDNVDEGYFEADDYFRIQLTPKEAEHIKFWKYYCNEKSPLRIQFGSGLYRYLSNEQAIQIIKDIVRVKEGIEEKDLALEPLNKYMNINKLTEVQIGEPVGPLSSSYLIKYLYRL